MPYTITGDRNTVSGFAVGKYIRAIRNARKREYAHKYYIWCLQGRDGNNGPDFGELSYMAAQAVRHNINNLLEGTEFAR